MLILVNNLKTVLNEPIIYQNVNNSSLYECLLDFISLCVSPPGTVQFYAQCGEVVELL